MLGTLGTLAAAGGWIGLSADEARAEEGGPKAYTLPPLPYEYDALEPHIDKETMMLHHDKHHAAYVKGLNDALVKLADVDKTGGEEALSKVRGLTDAAAFNGSGHALHSIFWPNMKKDGGGEPKGPLAQQITQSFGSFPAFQARFSAASTQVQGGGWGILAWGPIGKRLVILGAEKHQNGAAFGCIPLLVLDVWEHAYYLKYKNVRPEYVKAFWNVINWENVSERLAMAMRLTA